MVGDGPMIGVGATTALRCRTATLGRLWPFPAAVDMTFVKVGGARALRVAGFPVGLQIVSPRRDSQLGLFAMS